MEATRTHVYWEADNLHDELEKLLKLYQQSLGTVSQGVPAELVQGAVRIDTGQANVLAAGPADCVAPDDEPEPEKPSLELEGGIGDQCAGIIGGGVEHITPIQLWNSVMLKYDVQQKCEEELYRLRNTGKVDEKQLAAERLNRATAAAVGALAELRGKEVREQLQAFIDRQDKAAMATSSSQCASGDNGSSEVGPQKDKHTLYISHQNTFLNNWNPLFWHNCFVSLFPRGDCAEICRERSSKLTPNKWSKTLLTRADTPLWRQDVEFVASMYNVHLRRDQIRAVQMCVESAWFTEAEKNELKGVLC